MTLGPGYAGSNDYTDKTCRSACWDGVWDDSGYVGDTGVSTPQFIQVLLTNTSTENLRAFNREMRALPEVETCHMVAGGFDYLIKIRCADMQHYQRFLGEKLAAIPLVAQTHTYVVIEEVKSETAIALDNLPG